MNKEIILYALALAIFCAIIMNFFVKVKEETDQKFEKALEEPVKVIEKKASIEKNKSIIAEQEKKKEDIKPKRKYKPRKKANASVESVYYE